MTGRSANVDLATRTIARMGGAGRAGRALAPAADLMRSVGWRSYARQRRADAAAPDWTQRVRRNVYRWIWEDAATSVGAECRELSGDFLLIGKDALQTIVWYHTVMLDFGVTLQLALDKVAVHALLAHAGLPMAAHVEVDASDLDAAAAFLASADGTCVVKPARSTSGGEGVTCGVGTLEELERAAIWARRWDGRLLLERQAQGDEYRFLFIDGELIDVLRRRPPEVVGDGTSTIGDLIAGENGRRQASGGWKGTSYLHVDLDCILTLQRGGRSLQSIPARGETVRVKTAINQNGAAENQTIRPDAVGADLIADARAAMRATDLRFAGVEIITSDPSRSLRDSGGVVIEVNGTPGLQYHYLVDRPESATPVARRLLDVLLDPSRTRSYKGAPATA